jgi:hypothetical protein
VTSQIGLVPTVVVALMLDASSSSFDWLGLIRIVLMTLGGLVVVAIVTIVAIAIISGIMGILGKLKGKGNDGQRSETERRDPGRRAR